MTVTIRLPWPSSKLTPHAQGNWRLKAEATKAYKRAAWAIASEAKVPCDPTARMVMTYNPPSQRGDCHNVHGRLKAAIDGIAQAMGCDDKGFRISFPEEFGPSVKGGCVNVEIITENAMKIRGSAQ